MLRVPVKRVRIGYGAALFLLILMEDVWLVRVFGTTA